MKTENKFIHNLILKVKDEQFTLKVSEWAGQERYISSSASAFPGKWKNTLTPYMVEIMDNFSDTSNIQQVAVMKATQVGFTAGVIENAIGYTIAHSPCPSMFVSSTEELAKDAVETRIEPMLENSGLSHKIFSQAVNTRNKRTGNKTTKKEFAGGFLLIRGGKSASGLRSMSIKNLFMDEIDAMTDDLKEGDMIDLAFQRTKSFGKKKKVLYGSTPLIQQTSKIYKLYLRGDQRKYYVPCPKCDEIQVLVFDDKKTGAGLKFKKDKEGNLIYDSVGYQCCKCGEIWKNREKTEILAKGEWRTTATAKEQNYRSYHISALYSPPSMYSWEEMARDWIYAQKSIDKLRPFINLQLGEPWEERGESPKYERVMSRKHDYDIDSVPDGVLFLTGACDIQKDCIYIEILGHGERRITWSINWVKLEGSTESLNQGAWEKLDKFIEYLSPGSFDVIWHKI